MIAPLIFSFLPRLPWQLWLVIGAALILALGVWFIDSRAYSRGFSEADAQWVKRVEDEYKRQIDANKKAFDAASAEILRLRKKEKERDAEISRLTEAARRDANADADAIGANSVQRLNSID